MLRALIALGLLVATPAQAAWKHIDLPRDDVTLRAVAVTAAKQFRVSGSKGTYAVTDDAGKTWRLAVTPAPDLDYRGLAALNGKTAVLTSAGDGPAGQARIYRTPDGGATWALAFETKLPGTFLDVVAFRDARNGFVLGDPLEGRWFLLRTRDGGQTWSRIEGPPVKPGEAAFAASNSALFLRSKSEVWIVSGGLAKGRAFHSRDDGRNWETAGTPLAAGPTAGAFGGLALGPDRVVVVGGDFKDELRAGPDVATTGDGLRWQATDAGGRLLEGVGRLRQDLLIAVGPRGTSVSADDGLTWRPVDAEPFHAIACANGTCVAAGGRGHVGVWTD